MPELPEVETAARELHAEAAGKTIVGLARLDHPAMVETPELAAFEALLPGKRIEAVGRRAKWLLLALSDGWTLAIHLRMTGDVGVFPPEAEPDRHTHLILALSGGSRLFFRDPRKFGRVRLLDASGLAALDAAHGPEPLEPDFGPDRLAALLDRPTKLKPLLLDQSVIAGLGNIYVDEALWEAGLHPLRPAGSLTRAEAGRLHAAICAVLARAIASQHGQWRYYRTGFSPAGVPERYLNVYDRAGEPCLRCATPLARMVVAQRGTHLCPTCQPAPAKAGKP